MHLARFQYLPFLLLTLCFMGFVISCGEENDEDKDPREDQQIEQGYYEAVLVPLNVAVAGTPAGQLKIDILGDDVDAVLKMNDTPSGIVHHQYVHTGGTCPPSTTDGNADGYIDIQEAMTVTGPVLIPLDSDLSTQLGGGHYPVASRSGNYTYRKSTSLVRMMADLGSPDPDPDDIFVKMDPDEPLNLSGRVVMIYGVHSGKDLPLSVRSAGGVPAHRLLPIACGVITRVAYAPTPAAPTPVEAVPPRRSSPPTGHKQPEIIVQNSCESTVERNVIISGVKCVGGEVVQSKWDDRSGAYKCVKDQWIITIINPNDCDKDLCGNETVEQRFIANLRLSHASTPSHLAYYYIRPATPVSSINWKIIGRHWVRSEIRGGASVVPRN